MEQEKPQKMETEPMEKMKFITMTEEEASHLQQLLLKDENTQLSLRVRQGEYNLKLIEKLGAK